MISVICPKLVIPSGAGATEEGFAPAVGRRRPVTGGFRGNDFDELQTMQR
jgi:hypothetical protein